MAAWLGLAWPKTFPARTGTSFLSSSDVSPLPVSEISQRMSVSSFTHPRSISSSNQSEPSIEVSNPPRTLLRAKEAKLKVRTVIQSIGIRAHLPIAFSKRNRQDIVLFVGSPGAGKSTFYWRNLQGLSYMRINQDILKSVSLRY